MAEHSKFFDSLNPLDPDKVYTADEFIGYFGKLITDGIMKGEANMLKVETSGSNMNTIVDTGTAFLLAREYENDSKLSLTHEVESLGRSRIDRVVIRLMLNVDYRYIKAFVKKGVAGTSPIAPSLERTGTVYEISLAQVKIIGGQTYINVADVTDERGKVDICPWAGSKILPHFDDNALAEHIGNQKVHILYVQETWIPAVLVAGWNNMVGELSYYKDQFNIVYIRGVIKPTKDTDDKTVSPITTLPVGYRPPIALYLTGNILSPTGLMPVTISADGQLNSSSTKIAYNYSINISFRADQ